MFRLEGFCEALSCRTTNNVDRVQTGGPARRHVAGNAGCNRFFCTASVGESFSLGGVGATRRACPEPANSLEFSFLEALGQVVFAARVDDRLAFKDEAGVNVLRFVAVDPIDD